MNTFKENLPDPVTYFENEGLKLAGKSKWRTTNCIFHGGSDSMRINTESGGWCCMNCGVKGGDVLSYHMQAYGLEFMDAAKELGAWIDDGKPHTPQKPRPLSHKDALEVLSFEAMVVYILACDVKKGAILTEKDHDRLATAVGRINRIREVYQ
jgi:CHC2 zinc finger